MSQRVEVTRREAASPSPDLPRAVRLASLLVASALLVACGGDQGTVDPGTADARSDLRGSSDAYADLGLDALRRADGALELGGALFGTYCADCHGPDGRGDRGVMDLTRGQFNYGTSAEAIRTTIRDGRHSEMPAMGREYGEVELGQIVAYLRTLPSDEPLTEYESRGQTSYAEGCAPCHGEDGHGRSELGAPDLTDDYWQHGDSMMNIRLVITRGALSDCPPHAGELTPTEIELLTAYVLEWIGS